MNFRYRSWLNIIEAFSVNASSDVVRDPSKIEIGVKRMDPEII